MNIEDRINPWLKTPFDEEIHSKVKAMQQYPEDALDIKEIESTTNHDVKACLKLLFYSLDQK